MFERLLVPPSPSSHSFVFQVFYPPHFSFLHCLSHSLIYRQTLLNVLHICAYLCLPLSLLTTLARKSPLRPATQRKPSWASRERVREEECDEQMQIGDTNGLGVGGGGLVVCKLDDEKEGRREGGKEGRKEGGGGRGEMRGGRG